MNRKPLIFIIGNAMEFYDFMVFAFFTPLIGSLFFPSKDPFSSLLFGLTMLASAFIARPMGGILFGHLGDIFGRKFSLIFSLSIMAISTFGIGILPTVQEIGFIAPFLLFLLRFIQGLSAGGEYGGVAVLLMEVAPPQRRSFWGSFVPLSCGIGALLAACISSFLHNPSFPLWSWRIAFIIGGGIGFLALLMRLKVSESQEFEKLLSQNELNRKKSDFTPFITILKHHSKSFWETFLISSFHSCLIVMSFMYINIYLNQNLNIPMEISIFYNQFSLISFILSVLLLGYFSDTFRKEWFMKFITGLVVLFSYPIFLSLNQGTSFSIILAECLLGMLTGAYAACNNGYVYNLFPTEVRVSGIGIGYSLGMAAIGSTTPIICSLLINKFNNPMMPAIFLSVIGMIVLLVGSLHKSHKKQAAFS